MTCFYTLQFAFQFYSTGDVIFYLDAAAGIYLDNYGIEELTFYVNGQIIGFQYNNGGFYTSENPPNCSNNLFTSRDFNSLTGLQGTKSQKIHNIRHD